MSSCACESAFQCLWWPEVLLACVCKIWGGRNIEQRLANGFASFHTWKTANKQSSSLTKFELKTFKMSSSLGGMHSHACIMPAEFCRLSISNMHCARMHARLKCQPRGCGKGHDTTVLSKWLLSVMTAIRPDEHVPRQLNMHERLSWKMTCPF